MSTPIAFGTDGWRAIIAEDFTFHNVERVTAAVGAYVLQTYYSPEDQAKMPVLIGYDPRFLADQFAHRAACTLMSMGIPVKLVSRDVPTPVIAFAAQHEPTAGSLQFTASHNPPEYCGMKYIPHFGGPATNATTEKILANLDALPEDFQAPQLDVPRFDPRAPYMVAVKKMVDGERIAKAGIKAVFDPIHGASRGYLDELLQECGVQVKALRNWRDPLFGGCMPEPKPQYLTGLIQSVVSEKYDVGLATDGDADRFGAVDETGAFLSPNQLLALLTRHLVKNHKMSGAIVRTVATTHLLNRLAEMYGLEVLETPVGFKYIGELMRTNDVLIGGEESGGVSVKGHIPEKDGILGNLLIVEMMAYEKKPLSQIWAELLDEAGLKLVYRRGDLHLNHRTQRMLMDSLSDTPLKTIGGQKVAEIRREDGLKYYLDKNNWMLVRPSGTEPMIRLYFEGTSEQQVEAVMKDFNAQVETILSGETSAAKIKA